MLEYFKNLHLERMMNILLLIQCCGLIWMSFFFARGEMYPAAGLMFVNGIIFLLRYGSLKDLFESKISIFFFIFIVLECISFNNYLFDTSRNPALRGGLFYHTSLSYFFCYSIIWYINYIVFYVYVKNTDSIELIKGFIFAFFIAGICNNYRGHMLYHVKTSSLDQINYFYYTLIPIPLLFYFIKSKVIKYICIIIALLCVIFGYKRSGIFACGLLFVINYFLDSDFKVKRMLVNSILAILLVGSTFVALENTMAFKRTQTRMERLENDGGSGRTDNIIKVCNELKNAPFLNQLFGYGFMGHASKYRKMIDVEFIAILYYYGALGWIVYILIHFLIILRLINLYKNRTYWGKNVVCSYYSFYVILFFYSFAAEPFSYHFFFCLLFVYLGFIEALISKKY